MRRKLVYITNARIPTEKAHGIQIMKMCEAFANEGMDVELVVPMRFNYIKEDPFRYYGVKENFSIKKIPCIDLVSWGHAGFVVQYVSFTIFALAYLFFRKVNFVYTRQNLIALPSSFLKRNVFWEVHDNSFGFLTKTTIKYVKGIIVITESLKDFFIKKNVSEKKIFVAHDGVDLSKFDFEDSKEEIRKRLGLPKEKKIVLYTGHLYSWKGAGILAKAAEFFSDSMVAVFVGGTNQDVLDFKKEYGNNDKCLILGLKPHTEIPLYLKSADVLVLPNSASSQQSAVYTSPMKLFEYMASGVSIVASDLSSTREVLSENNAFFAEPDNEISFAHVIEYILSHPVESKMRAENAQREAVLYSWEKRSKEIFKFLDQN